MDELIRITDRGQGLNTVNARDLHGLLGIGKDFSTWIKVQIDRARLVKERDYLVVSIPPLGGAVGNRGFMVEYHLSIDAAKHIGMISGTEKGFEIRDYFIAIEKQHRAAFALPKTFGEALRLAADLSDQNERQAKQIEVMTPKAEFYDAVTESQDTFEIAAVAKLLNMGMGRNKLFDFLRAEKILMENNRPYQVHVDAGRFRLVEQSYELPSGETKISLKTVVYQKGIDYIRKRLQERKGQDSDKK